MKYIFHFILMLCFISNLQAQNIEIKGKVYDAYTGNPISDANIKATDGTGTVTNKDGNFTITCDDTAHIHISHLSYDTYTFKASQKKGSLKVGLIPTSYNLNEVAVQSPRAEFNPNLKQAQAIAVITPKRIEREDGLDLDKVLNLEPGIFASSSRIPGSIGDGVAGLSSDIKIRGYVGYRSSGGYKMYLNGIPLTDAEGGAAHGDVDYSIIGKMEVIKGPSSSLYGTGIGGAIKLYTKQPKPQSTRIVQQALVGSYGLFRSNTRLESATDNSSILLNYGHQYYKGWIPNTESRKNYMTFAGTFRPSDRQTFFVYSSYSTEVGNNRVPSVDSAQYFNREIPEDDDPYVPLSQQEVDESYRMGVSHSYQFGDHISNVTSLFTSGSGRTNRNIGGRTEINFTYGGDHLKLKGTVGDEIQKSLSASIKYNDLDDGSDGSLNTFEDYTAFQNNLFTQWELHMPKGFVLTAGASYNMMEFTIDDHLGYPGNPSSKLSNSGYKRYDPVITPRISLLKAFDDNYSVYVNISQGYSPYGMGKTITIPYLGTVNEDLKPEFATLYEVGSKGSILNKRLSYQFAVFTMDISDKITTQSVLNDQGKIIYSFYTNTGDQIDKGIELSLTYALINDQKRIISSLVPFASFTYSDFYYDDFKSDNNNDKKTVDYTGNQVAEVPPVMFNAGLDMDFKWGFYLTSTFRYISDAPGDFENAHYAEGYSLLGAKIGYRKTLGEHFMVNVSIGGNNLTNSLYYVGGGSSRTPLGTVYSPGPYNATYYSRLSLSYKF